MDPLLITTQVDLSGAQQLSTGVVAAMTKIIAAQQAVKEQATALRDTYSQLGAAAAQGSSQAAGVIAAEMAALAEKKIALQQAQEAYRDLAGAVDEEAAAHVRNAESIQVETVSQRASISERQAAAASIRILEGNLQGSTRAAGTFLATTLGLGPVLQAAFPVIGAIALIEVLARIPEVFHHIQDAMAGWDKDSEKVFQKRIAEAEHLDQVYERFTQQQAKIPTENLEGSAKYKAEIESLGEYQDRVARLSLQFNALKAALDAVGASSERVGFLRNTGEKPKDFGVQPQEAIDADAIRANITKQLEAINNLRNEEAKKYNLPIPMPLTINFGTSADTLRKQVDELVEMSRKEISRLSEATTEAGISKTAKAGPLSKDQADEQVEAAKRTEEATLASLEHQKASADLLYQQGTIDATQWRDATVAAADLAAAAHRRYAETAVDAFTRSGQAQKAAAAAAEQFKIEQTGLAKVEEENAKATEQLNKTLEQFQAEAIKDAPLVKEESEASKELTKTRIELVAANSDLVRSERDLQLAQQKAGYSERAGQISEAAAKMIGSEDYVRAQTKALYQQEYSDLSTHLDQQLAAKQAAIDRTQGDATRVQGDITSGAVSGDSADQARIRLVQLQAELAQEKADYNAVQTEIVTATAKFQQQMSQLAAQAFKEQERYINDFVTQATGAMNSFLVTVITTTGTVNGKVSEWRFIGEQWQKMVFQMEKDFLSMVLHTIENTALFRQIQGGIQGALGGVLSHIGLGGGGGGVTGGINIGSTPSGITGLQGLGLLPGAGAAAGGTAQTAAATAQHAALLANTAATTANTGATGTQSAASSANTAGHAASTAGLAANTGSTAVNTAAVGVQSTAVGTSTIATTANTVTHVAATVENTVATGANTIATIADAIIQAAHPLASGGLVQGPGTETSDSIPANLSHGEFVVNASSVKQPGALALLHALNSGKLGTERIGSTGGSGLPGFAAGGLVGFTVGMAQGGFVTNAGTSNDTGQLISVTIVSAPTMERSLEDIAHNTAYLKKAEQGKDIFAALTGVLGFEEGGIVPTTGLHLLHANERVLNVRERSDYEGLMSGASVQSPFAEAARGEVAGPSAHGSGEPSSSFNLHLHQGNVSALDGAGVDAVLAKGRSSLVGLVRQAVHRGAINVREISRR